MERRRDPRHGFQYVLTLRCPRTRRLWADLVTRDVSASGIRVRADAPHGLRAGDLLEVQLVGAVPAGDGGETLVMAADATVVRAGKRSAALRFETPLAY